MAAVASEYWGKLGAESFGAIGGIDGDAQRGGAGAGDGCGGPWLAERLEPLFGGAAMLGGRRRPCAFPGGPY